MTVYDEIRAAIDYAWSTSDPEIRQRQIDLVGDSHIPTPEELISLIASKIICQVNYDFT